jgi:membrane-bound serine protease (ClpP class)
LTIARFWDILILGEKILKRNKVLFILSIFFLLAFVAEIPSQEKPPIFVIEVDGDINPATGKFIIDSIEKATKQNAQCLVIQLDTPGGGLESTRLIVKKMLSSSIPIIVYVSPTGARAGSAGVFITMAANVAVMAPGTHIGAAHPVTLGGGEGKESKTMTEKIVNDTVAFIKNIAKTRGRNVDWAEKAVRKSVSITEEEAVKLNVVDFISPDVSNLLTKIDGKVVKFDGVTRTLQTKGIQPKTIQMSWSQKLLAIISHPQIALYLLMLASLGIFFELSNPGAILPGVVGGISLLLSLYVLQVLSVNYAGLALILFAFILFIAEIKVVSHGLLAIGGVISLFLGSIMLFDTPEAYMRLSLGVIIPAVLVTSAFFIFAMTMAIRARLKKPTTGLEGLIGETGIAAMALSPEGKVSIHGEFWNATSDQNIEKGEKIQVVGVDNLKLKVKKI